MGHLAVSQASLLRLGNLLEPIRRAFFLRRAKTLGRRFFVVSAWWRGRYSGAPGWIRTSDHRIRNPMLYPLSYGCIFVKISFYCIRSFMATSGFKNLCLFVKPDSKNSPALTPHSCLPIRIAVKAVPGASKNEIVGWMGKELKIRVKAPPEDGKANQKICELLAQTLAIPSKAVTLLSGGASPHKVLAINIPCDLSLLGSPQTRSCNTKLAG